MGNNRFGKSMQMVSLCLMLMIFGVISNLNKDNNIHHGHDQQYFDKISEQARSQIKQESNAKVTYVHIVPHTHDDVGWLKTLDEYFWGLHDDVHQASVQILLDSAIEELTLNPDRKFTYVEMAFFMKWWELQDDKMKETVRNLVKQGQLEFVNAGWSMNDEACPYYSQIIENMMIGHRFLKEEFGYTINIGWHLDPFGHSSANAALFADMGFDAFFYARLDYQDKEKRLKEKSMEYLWRPFPEDKGESAQIFTHALYDHYYPPPSFCWETSKCAQYDEPVVKDKITGEGNYKERIQQLYEWVSHMKDHYRTNNLLIPMGGDFFYLQAHKIFKNTDRLIEYFNEEYKNFKLIYSTPQQYLKAVHDSGKSFPIKYDDQFPYADKQFAYWTGYFTSRAVSKGNIREFDRYVEHKNHLWTNVLLNEKTSSDVKNKILNNSEDALRVVGVTQHHDAVTGTEKQHVADDYQRQIDEIYNKTKATTEEAVTTIFERKFGKGSVEKMSHCSKANNKYIECDNVFTSNEDGDKYLVVYKSHPDDLVKIKLPSSEFKLIDPTTFLDIENQAIFCKDTDCKMLMKDSRTGLVVYKVIKDDSSKYLNQPNDCNRIWSQFQSLMMMQSHGESGARFWYVSCDTPREDPMFGDKSYCAEQNITIDIRYYPSSEDDEQSSGAYIFRPWNDIEDSIPYWNVDHIKCYNESTKGVKNWIKTMEVESDKGSMYIRIIEDDRLGLQIETDFTGIDLDIVGQEVTVNVEAEFYFDNNKVFYTDSNGLQMQKRQLDYRPTWDVKLNGTEHISANYYPINSAISMVDNAYLNHTMTLLNDRSQGGSALKHNRLELMIDRRIYKDDSRGVDEPLNETDKNGNPLPVTTHHILLLEKDIRNFTQINGFSRIKAAQERLGLTTEAMVAEVPKDSNLNSLELTTSYRYDNSSQIIIQVYPTAFDEILVRVENPEDYFTYPDMDYIPFDIDKIATEIYKEANDGKDPFTITITELTLSGSETIAEREKHRLKWKSTGKFLINFALFQHSYSNSLVIFLLTYIS